MSNARYCRRGCLANRGSDQCSATEPSPHPAPQPPAPRNRDVATVHLGGDTSGHDHGPEGVGSRAGADHAGSSGHDRVVVLVAEPLASRPCRSRLCSASLAPHDARPSQPPRNECLKPAWQHAHHGTFAKQMSAIHDVLVPPIARFRDPADERARRWRWLPGLT
jgi:hypothetical protein